MAGAGESPPAILRSALVAKEAPIRCAGLRRETGEGRRSPRCGALCSGAGSPDSSITIASSPPYRSTSSCTALVRSGVTAQSPGSCLGHIQLYVWSVISLQRSAGVLSLPNDAGLAASCSARMVSTLQPQSFWLSSTCAFVILAPAGISRSSQRQPP